MITYFKMKKNEWKIKAQLYGIAAAILDNQKDIISLVQRLYLELKDVPSGELRKDLTDSLAHLIHEENHKTK